MFSRALAFNEQSARYVGRVGALAVALGVGAAIVGFSGVAAADGDTPDSRAVGPAGSSGLGDSGRAAATRGADRRNAPGGRVSAPAAASEATTPTTGRAVTPVRRAAGSRAGAESGFSRARAALRPAVVSPQSVAVDVGGGDGVVSALPSRLAVSGGPVPESAPAQPIATVATSFELAATAAAAPATALLAADGDPLAALSGGGGAPLLAPLAWATLAAVRREDLAGATTGVAPADAVATEDLEFCAESCVKGLSIVKGAVGDSITITGERLGGTTTVRFGCTTGSSECGWGVVAVPSETPTKTQVKVTVPDGAPSGYIQLSGVNADSGIPWSAKSQQSFTVDGAMPTIAGFTPLSGNIGTGGPEVTITGLNFTDAKFVQFGSGQQKALEINEDGTAITVAIPDGATTGPIVVGLQTGGTVSTGQFTVPVTSLPPLSTCSGPGGSLSNCAAVSKARVTGINALSTIFGQAFLSSGPVGKCTADGCPVPFGQTAPSVANTVGIYAFNILYSLSGATTPVADIGTAVTALATQPDVLNFISQSVAGSAALAALPPAVATTIGDAVKTFVQTSFASPTVANALVPFLRDLNLPTDIPGTLEFSKLLAKDPIGAFLSRFNSPQWPKAQADLQNQFFGNGAVQTQLGAAFTAAVNVLVGSPALSGYLGQVAASALLGQPVGPSNPLAMTIGSAVGTLFSSIGGTVATDAGTAFTTFLAQPVQGNIPSVATALADVVVNTVVGFLRVENPPYAVALPSDLAPAGDAAVTQFVNLVLAPGTGAIPALGTFAAEVAVGVLADQQVVADQVTNLLGGGALAQAVGQQAGAAVATFVSTPAGGAAVSQLVTSVVGGVLGADGVVTALADTAGGLASAVLNGETLNAALAAAVQTLLANPAIDAAVGPAITDGLDTFLGDTDVQSALAAAAGSLVTGLIGDTTVQAALSGEVASAVSPLFGGGALGQAVGERVGAATVELLRNPVVSGAVGQLVTSVVGGVLAADGVSAAVADVAGDLVTAVLDGESLNDALNAAVAALGSNAAIDAAVGPVVTAAVATFLGNADLRPAVDTALSSLVTGLIGNAAVQSALGTDVASAVSTALGGGALGEAVGERVGAAVVSLITDPTVSGALVELVDTVFSDFISSQGVVTALSAAAGQLATAAVEGTLVSVLPQVEKALRANADIDGAIQASVVAAVTQFLGDTDLWSTVDTGITTLVTGLINDTTVQQTISDRVANEVNSFLGFGPISVVGDDVGAAVVALITSPAISRALVDLVDTVFYDFFTSAGVVDALAGAAGDVALGVFTGEPLDAALEAAGKKLQANTDIDAGVQASVSAAVTQFLGNPDVWSTVDAGITALATQLITDPVVQSALNDRIAEEVSTQLGGGDLGTVVGAQVAATVIGLLTDPVVGGALLEVVDTLFSDLFVPNLVGNPVPAAFGEAAGDLALAALTLTGPDFTAAVQGIVGGLRNNPALDTGVQSSVEAAVSQLLDDTAAWTAVGGAIATLAGELIGDNAVQQALADRVANEVNSFLGFGPISVAGEQVGAFVVGLLTNPVVSAALPDVVDSVFTDFFGAAGVDDAISGAAGDIALAVLTGESLTAAVQDALNALQANPAIQAGVQGTVADALGVINTDILSNTTFQQDLGQAITGLINELAADPPVQALVTERFGPAIGGLFANTAVVGDIATAIGTAVTGLLGYSGVSTAVTDAAAQFIDAVLGGTATGQAATQALQALQADPSVVAAANAVIPPIVNNVLDDAEVGEALGVVAQQVTIARLEESWFNIPFLDRLIGQVAKVTVEDLLTRVAGQKLVGDLAVKVVLGLPVRDAREFVVDQVLRRPALQIALGFSIGAGVGSLFGDNIIGDVIGWVAGFPATAVVGVGSAVIAFYQWIVGGWLSLIDALAAPAQSTEVRYLQLRVA